MLTRHNQRTTTRARHTGKIGKIGKISRTSRTRHGKNKVQFFFNPDNPNKSFNVYIDKNPNDTIPITYKTLADVKHTIQKLEKLYKTGKYPHKRIWQVAMIMKVRLGVLKEKKPAEYLLASRYLSFLSKRTTLAENQRHKTVFIF
jgi:hypothetical protein